MVEQFKQFTNDDTDLLVRARRRLLSCDRGVLVACSAVALLGVTVLALSITLGLKIQRPDLTEVGGTSAMHGSTDLVYGVGGACINPTCLTIAAWSINNLNRSVAPCDNFYQYACGNYKQSHPIYSQRYFRNVLNDVRSVARGRVESMLLTGHNKGNDSAEAKVKTLFGKCYIGETRGAQAATALVGHLEGMGGWWLLGPWNASSWDLNRALQHVHGRLGVDAFWSSHVRYTHRSGDRLHLAVGLVPGGTGSRLRWGDYTRNNTLAAYRKKINTIAKLFIRDVGVTDADIDTRMQTFSDDIVAMEEKIYQVMKQSRGKLADFSSMTNLSVEFENSTQRGIDWYEVLKSMYGDDWVNEEKYVMFFQKGYFEKLDDMLTSFQHGNETRMLSNYMVWMTIQHYLMALPLEYVHAHDVFLFEAKSSRRFSRRNWCFRWATSNFDEALVSLYIQNQFGHEHKQKVAEMMNLMRQEFIDDIEKYDWMDNSTKATAKKKLSALTFKVGFPEDLSNETIVDQMYEDLQVRRDAFLVDAMILVTRMKRSFDQRKLRTGTRVDEWASSSFGIRIVNVHVLNDITLPAAYLQTPLYDPRLPLHVNLGSLGANVGLHLTHTIDAVGRKYQSDGTVLSDPGWWSQMTLRGWKRASQTLGCANARLVHNRPDTWKNLEASKLPHLINRLTDINADSNGIRLAYKALQAHLSVSDREQLLPGLNLTTEQTFFLSYAQTHCSNFGSIYLKRSFSGIVSPQDRVNLALSMSPEFSSAFQCGTSPMNPELRCSLV